MHREQPRLPGPVTGGAAGQRPDAGHVQADRFQQQHREEQVGLKTERQPGQPRGLAGLGFGEGQHAYHDVGVRAFLVGVGMVAVVLADPPAVAQPNAQVAEQDADDVVGLTGAEDLAVPGVVTQEPDLREHDGQERGHGQLPPRVTDHGEGCPPGGQQHDGGTDLPPCSTAGAAPAARRCLTCRDSCAYSLPPRAAAGAETGCARHGGRLGAASRDCTRNSSEAHRDQCGDVPPGSRAATRACRCRKGNARRDRYRTSQYPAWLVADVTETWEPIFPVDVGHRQT